MATTARDSTSHVKEKTTRPASSTTHQNDSTTQGRKTSKPFAPSSATSKGLAILTDKSPHYLKPTVSSTKDPCTNTKKKASDDTGVKYSQSRRKSIEKAPSPAQLKRTLSSSSPHGRRVTSPSPPPKKGISPVRVVPEKSTSTSARTLTPKPKSAKAQPVTKPVSIKKSASTLTPTRPKKVSKASTASTNTPTAPSVDVIETPLVKVEEEEKAKIGADVAEESVEVVQEQTTQVEDEVDIDQTPVLHVESEPKSLETGDIEIMPEEVLQTPIEEEVRQNEDIPKEEEEQSDNIEDNIKDLEESQPELEANVEENREETGKEETSETEIIEEKIASPTGDEETPQKLNFQQRKQLEPKEVQDEPNLRLKFKERKDDQGVQAKKESPAYNDVIEETASKLVGKKQSKVRALVGAFETVINLENDTQQTEGGE